MPGVRSSYEITSSYAGSDFISGKLARYSLVSGDVLNELAVCGIGWDVEYGCKRGIWLQRSGVCFQGNCLFGGNRQHPAMDSSGSVLIELKHKDCRVLSVG